MGDIVRKVDICSVTSAGNPGTCATVYALIDPGASSTVISARLAKRLGGKLLPARYGASIEGRKHPVKLTAIKLHAPSCTEAVIPAVVSEQLVARAKLDVDMLLGHDYLQRKRVALLYAETPAEHKAACTTSRARR